MKKLRIILLVFSILLALAASAYADMEVHIRGGTTDGDGLYETIAGVENVTGTSGAQFHYTDSITLIEKGYNFSDNPYDSLMTLKEIPYYWWRLSSPTYLSLGDDELSSGISLGFSTLLYGDYFSTMYVSSNGFVTFNSAGPDGCCEGQNLPDSNTPNALVAGWWEDLRPASGGGVGYIKYQAFGSAPNRKMVVEFDGVGHYGDNNKKVSFQIVLKENQ